MCGEFTGPNAPYGYMKSPDDKHKLMPNPDTADTVKKIFQLAASGMTAFKIGTMLKRDNILKPRAYTMQTTNGKYQRESLVKYPYDWTQGTIMVIIKNEVYLGHMVCNKQTTKSFKNKKIISNDKSEWIITRNTHEPLVDEYLFEQAQKATEVKRKTWTSEPHIFAGLLRCPDCGRAMHYQKRTERSYTASYSCNTYTRYGKEYCSMHYIRYEDLYQIVLNDIRRYADLAKNHEQEFIEELNRAGSNNTKKQLAQHVKEKKRHEKRLSEIGQIVKRLYEDHVIGMLSDERFYEMSKGYEDEGIKLKADLRKIQKAIDSFKNTDENSRQFTSMIQKYFNIVSLDALTLNETISKIEVYEREFENGVRKQQVDIYYNFMGIIEKHCKYMTADRRFRPETTA